MAQEFEERYAKQHKDLDKNVYLAVGSLEEDEDRLPLQELHERLLAREYPGLALTFEVLANETHGSAANPAFQRGLKAVFAEEVAASRAASAK